ncbi:MAG: acetyltransferase [Deltaproteobacteria bacterium]|nr:acetyltransferase [Deltaproteobacteria bacterium]
MGPLIVFGAGGHGKVVADAAISAGFEVIAFGDDDARKRGTIVLGIPVSCIGPAEVAELGRARSARVVVAIGDNRQRARCFDRILATALPIATVIHRAATIAASARVGSGTVVLAGAVVNPGAVMGDDVIVNTSASVDHDNVIGDHVHVCPGVHLGGGVRVGHGTHLGIGTSVRDQVSIGELVMIGAGAVVVGALPDRVLAVGCPARVVRAIEGWGIKDRSSG